MTSFFKPDVPQQNPAVARQQEDERLRAEAANTRATQDQLQQETLLRGRSRGVRSLLGSFGPTGTSLGSG